MGGQIKVHAVKDKGSKFWFVLPITPVRSNCNEVVNIGNDASQILVENNAFKQSKEDNNDESGHCNKVQVFNDLNEDSYESKDLELEDIYESDDMHE